MFPLSDDNPRESFPVVTLSLIGLCVLAFLWQISLGDQGNFVATVGYGLIPARLFGEAELPPEVATLPPWATIFTSMFLHGGWLHLGGNMLFLWIFGDNVEDSMGRVRYLIFYLACGVAAALAQSFADTSATDPMIGASGAIAGVLGAYILLFPRATIRTLIFVFFFVTIVRIPAVLLLGLWFLLQFWSAIGGTGGEGGGVAFWAHVGGFFAGVVLVFFFRRRKVDLMQPPRSAAFSTERVRGPWD